MFQSKKPNSSCGIRHARKFRLRTDASRDTWCSRALNTHLPRVIAERAIHHVIVMDGWSFGQSQWSFLVDKLNHAHWLRIKKKRVVCPSYFITHEKIYISSSISITHSMISTVYWAEFCPKWSKKARQIGMCCLIREVFVHRPKLHISEWWRTGKV